MKSRVYLLLDILEEKFPFALQTLKNIQRVSAVDELEGHPNIMVIIEAPDRQQLVDILMPVLDSVDRITKDVRLLINQETEMPFYDAGNTVPYQKQVVCQTLVA